MNAGMLMIGEAAQIHIAPHGRDTAKGTASEPFLTLERARDEIRRFKSHSRLRGAQVILAGGVYERTTTFALTSADSGTAEMPIRYVAAPGPPVRIIGGQRVSGFRPVKDTAVLARLPSAARSSVVVLDLAAVGIHDLGLMRSRGFCRPYANASLEPFFNATPMRLAAWPKDSQVEITSVSDPGSRPRYGETEGRGALYTYRSDRPTQWARYDDLWVQGMFGKVWADDMIAIMHLDPQTAQVRLAEPHLYGVSCSERTGARFRFINVLDEMSQAGEWYLDHAGAMLYLFPPSPVEEAEVAVSLLEDPLVAMEDASYVEFQGITFEISRGMGIYIEGGAGNRITGCTFRNLGTVAVSLGMGIDGPEGSVHEYSGRPTSRRLGNLDGHCYANPAWNRQAGHDHRVSECLMHDIGEGGVILSGGNRRTLEPGGNRVDHCRIFRTNRLTTTYRPAIRIDGVGNIASNNHIEDLPHSAIIIEGNEHRIEYNRIRNVVTGSEDGGAIYAGRDIAMHGTVIRGNLITGARGGILGFRSGIYLDDQVGGILVADNILIGNSIAAVISGRHIRVEANLLIGNDKPIGLDGRGPCQRHLDVLKALGCDREPWISRYPEAARAPDELWGKPVGMTACGNVALGGPPLSFDLGIDTAFLMVEDNLELPLEGEIILSAEGVPVFAPESPLYQLLPHLARTLDILESVGRSAGHTSVEVLSGGGR